MKVCVARENMRYWYTLVCPAGEEFTLDSRPLDYPEIIVPFNGKYGFAWTIFSQFVDESINLNVFQILVTDEAILRREIRNQGRSLCAGSSTVSSSGHDSSSDSSAPIGIRIIPTSMGFTPDQTQYLNQMTQSPVLPQNLRTGDVFGDPRRNSVRPELLQKMRRAREYESPCGAPGLSRALERLHDYTAANKRAADQLRDESLALSTKMRRLGDEHRDERLKMTKFLADRTKDDVSTALILTEMRMKTVPARSYHAIRRSECANYRAEMGIRDVDRHITQMTACVREDINLARDLLASEQETSELLLLKKENEQMRENHRRDIDKLQWQLNEEILARMEFERRLKKFEDCYYEPVSVTRLRSTRIMFDEKTPGYMEKSPWSDLTRVKSLKTSHTALFHVGYSLKCGLEAQILVAECTRLGYERVRREKWSTIYLYAQLKDKVLLKQLNRDAPEGPRLECPLNETELLWLTIERCHYLRSRSGYPRVDSIALSLGASAEFCRAWAHCTMYDYRGFAPRLYDGLAHALVKKFGINPDQYRDKRRVTVLQSPPPTNPEDPPK